MSPTSFHRRGAVVLCGGESRRMGRDKALLPFGEELMLQRTVRLLSEVVPRASIVVVAAADQALPPLSASVRIVRDEARALGPVPAIVAGLQTLGADVDSAFVIGCDAPLLKPVAARWLFERLERDAAVDGVVPQDAERLYPLFAVYRTACADRFAEAGLNVGASLHDVLRSKQLRPRFVDVDELRAADPRLKSLVNCNTPEEYARALGLAGL